jgi:hypothetical protein
LEPLPVSFTEKPKMKIVFYVHGCLKYINVLYAKEIFLCILLSLCVYVCFFEKHSINADIHIGMNIYPYEHTCTHRNDSNIGSVTENINA